jgi:hypothetical protein
MIAMGRRAHAIGAAADPGDGIPMPLNSYRAIKMPITHALVLDPR